MRKLRRVWKRGLIGLLAAVMLLTGGLERLAYAEPAQDDVGIPSLSELLEQIVLSEDDLSVDDTAVEGDEPANDADERQLAITDAVYGLPVKISAAPEGAPGTGDSRSASVSGDGRYVAYASASSNLVAGDTNGMQDIFLHDRLGGTTKRISLGAGGVQADGDSYAPTVSVDGAYVLFTSKATNLTEGDANLNEDLFLYDDKLGTVQRIAEYVPGSEFAGAGSSYQISADGRYVAYAGKTGSTGTCEIWLLDRRPNPENGKISPAKLITRQKYIYETFRARLSISADGRFVAFDSRSTDITPDDVVSNSSTKHREVYLYDAAKDEMTKVSRGPDGKGGNNYSYYPIISADGRYVAYLSMATNIVPADTKNTQDLYVYDRLNGTTELASVDSGGIQPGVDVYDPSISADGRYVSFHTDGAYDPGDSGRTDVYIRDRLAGVTRWISKTASGGNADQPADRATLSADGRTIVFESKATNMEAAADPDSFTDIYAVELGKGASAPVWPAEAAVTAVPGAAYVSLSWPEVTGAAYYKVLQDDRIAGIVTGTSFAADGLAPGTSHRYRVAAGSAGYAWSEWSVEAAATTLTSSETTPPGRTAANVAAVLGGAQVSWTYPTDPDIVGAKVLWRKLRGSAQQGPTHESVLYPKSVVNAHVPNLENGQFYEFAVAIVDGDGNRSVSEWARSKLPDGPAIVRMDVRASDGRPAGSDDVWVVDMTEDGRYTLFQTKAQGIVPGDDSIDPTQPNTPTWDLYLYDAELGATQLISRTPQGKSGNNDSKYGSISGNGRWIVFDSSASNLTELPDTNGKSDVFLYDRDLNGNGVYDEPGDTSVTKISTPLKDNGQANGLSSGPVISADGSTIIFGTAASNLVDEPPASSYIVILKTESRELKPLLLPDGRSPNANGDRIDLSADGKTMVFYSYTSFVPEDTNGKGDVYWFDWSDPEAKKLVWVSGLIDNRKDTRESARIDGIGRYVVFNITHQNNQYMSYIFDSAAPAGTVPEPLMTVPQGSPMTLDSLTAQDISDDGRLVLFSSQGKNIVPGLTDNITKLYMRDLLYQTTSMVSLPYDPSIKIAAFSSSGVLSGDGTRIAYKSEMMNMVSGSERSKQGVYVQRIVETAPPASWPPGSALTASDIGRTSVRLTWTPADRAAGGYKITGGPVSVDVPTGDTEAVITDLAPDTDYTFTIQAASENGTWTSDGPSATVRTQAGEGLADLTLTVQGAHVQLVWGNPASGSGAVSAFRIMRKQGAEEWQTLATLEDAGARSYTDRTVAPGKTYTYAIRSVDGSGKEAPYSVEKTIAVGGFDISSFSYTMPRYFRQYAAQGDKVVLTMRAAADAEAKAELAYEDANGGNRMLELALTEAAEPGLYKGEFTVPEAAAKLKSLKAYIEEDGVTAEAEALREPIAVGGTVELKLVGDLPLSTDSLLTIYSKTAYAYQTVKLKGLRSVTMKGLPAANDYTLSLNSAGGIDLFEDNPVPPFVVEEGDRHTILAEPQFPASLSMIIYTMTGTASDVQVIVSDEDGKPLASGITLSNGNLSFPAFKRMAGKKAVIHLIPKNPQYAEQQQTVTLDSGMNRLQFWLTYKTESTLSGTVTDKDGKPVRDALVQATYRGRYFKAQTDALGRYTLAVPAGDVSVQAFVAGSFASSNASITTIGGQSYTVNIQYVKPIPAVIDLKLYTETESGGWVGPYELDWREMIHYHINTSAQLMSRTNPLLVNAVVGQSVKVCADGYEGGFGKACTDVVIADDRPNEAVLQLPYTKVKVVGLLTETPAQVRIYKMHNGSSRSFIMNRTIYDRALSLKLPGAGVYELSVASPNGKSLTRAFNVQEGETINLGELVTSDSGAFAGKEGNSVWLGANNPAPGTVLRVNATYANSLSVALSDVSIALDVPADTKLVQGSVVWNGKSVTPELTDGRYIVQLGTIKARGSGSLQYLLLIADEPSSETADVSPRIRYQSANEQKEEEIGFTRADIAGVTISAPGRTAFRKFHVTGTATAGSRVEVFAGDRIVGTAETAPNGRWKTSVEIEGNGNTAIWQLRAAASLGERRWSSAASSVRYDANSAEPIEFTMGQPDGRTIRLDPREGETRFPYVFAPGYPFIVTLKFNRPELAHDVAFYIGETRVPASLMNGVYQAVIFGSSVGAIGIDYSTRESPESVAGTPPPAEEIKEQLPPAFRDIRQEDLYISPREGGDRKQSMGYIGVLPGTQDKEARLKVNAALERTTYTPSASDLALAQETGVPLYGYQMKQSFKDGVLRIELSGYLPEDQFSAGLDVSKAFALMAAGAETHSYAGLLSEMSGGAKKAKPVQALSGAVGVVAARIGLAIESTAGANTWKTIDAAYSIYDGRGSGGTLNDLEYLMDKAARHCDPDLVPAYLDHIEFLKNHLIAVELTKAGIMVAAAAAGPATFGLGTIALFVASNAIGKVLDAQLAGWMTELNNELDRSCNVPKKPKKKIANPEWIYDPSGYVYEVTEDNRIEGVKATALNWNEAASRWDVWDSDWYGQENPLYTDADGRYAWDVPEGKWKVLYEKEGYLPAESEELTVLPPHFDVNIPMISTLPAKPVKVEAAPGGEYVDILFDRPVKGDTVSGTLFAVVDPETNEDAPGAWTLVDPVIAGGENASRRVRFAPSTALDSGRTYTVIVDEAVQSYAGIPMGEGFETEVPITTLDETPPAPVIELTAEADNDDALVYWKVQNDPDLAKIVVWYKAQGAAGDGTVVEIPSGRNYALLEGLSGSTVYEIEVRAYDAAGNYSAARTTTDTAASQPASADITPPGPVTAAAVTAGTTSAELVWHDPTDSDLSAVNLQWAKRGEAFVLDPVTVAKGSQKYTVNGLSPSTEYEIVIWAVDLAGNASPQQSLFVTTKAPGPGGPGPVIGGGGQQPDPVSESADFGEVGGELSFFGGKLKLRLSGNGTTTGEAKKATVSKAGEVPTPSDMHLRPVSEAFGWKLDTDGKPTSPIKLTMAYDDSLLNGADVRKLGLYRQDAADKGKWTYVGGVVSSSVGTVSAEILEPGVYAVLIAEYTFSDLTGHWSRSDVEALAARHIVTGLPDGTFRPDREVTRAEFAKLLLPLIPAGSGSAAVVFSDVPENAWFAEAVAKASAAGIVKGAGGKFRPNDPVTREEMAVMLFRLQGITPDIKLNAEALLADYVDGAKVSGWARLQVAYNVQAGLLKGSGGKLNPGASATRAEAAVLVLRTLHALDLVSQ